MRGQADREPPGLNGVPYLANFALLVEVDQVDGKLHEKRMDRFARADPESLTWFQPFVLQQACTPLLTGVRDLHGPAQNNIAGLVAHLYFQF